ncbi:hypothetical protein FGO68_gene16432 [Halteria grandinella]|uniref:Uncharacterized protein n=1 Tax=Halteria grandinella TaxID=5974 RepID=A0A8J8T3P7_HALGN|nr:hypothetical protein FGO68_gene16432 [Halteria grandinella]
MQKQAVAEDTEIEFINTFTKKEEDYFQSQASKLKSEWKERQNWVQPHCKDLSVDTTQYPSLTETSLNETEGNTRAKQDSNHQKIIFSEVAIFNQEQDAKSSHSKQQEDQKCFMQATTLHQVEKLDSLSCKHASQIKGDEDEPCVPLLPHEKSNFTIAFTAQDQGKATPLSQDVQITQDATKCTEKPMNPKKRKLKDFKQPSFTKSLSNPNDSVVAEEQCSNKGKKFRKNPKSSERRTPQNASPIDLDRWQEILSEKLILKGYLANFFNLNKTYQLVNYKGGHFGIEKIGTRKADFKKVNSLSSMIVFRCATCSSTLTFSSSSNWELKGNACSICECISLPKTIENPDIMETQEIDSETLRISQVAFGGALQGFIRENPEYRLRFSYGPSIAKCIPTIINKRFLFKYTKLYQSSEAVNYGCTVRSCPARIRFYLSSNEDIKNCAYELINLEYHGEECVKPPMLKAPTIDHSLKEELSIIKQTSGSTQRSKSQNREQPCSDIIIKDVEEGSPQEVAKPEQKFKVALLKYFDNLEKIMCQMKILLAGDVEV